MGLSLWVGMLSQTDPAERPGLREEIALLNEVLLQRGLPRHNEPEDLPDDAVFEAQMLGYSGLHYVRRLAAHHMLTGCLPAPATHDDAADDPLILEANNAVMMGRRRPRRGGWVSRLLGRRSVVPPVYSHLLLHSDCEGFYVPQDFPQVILDDAEPQRPSLGGMVGSSVRLLAECHALAGLIGLPADIDVESEELWKVADQPAKDGPLWKVYGAEAFGLARLIRGCEVSIRHGALLVFC
ncbi:hypothetical protein [uncultured Phenylobacterium sp.]|uniref:hypothetical protein n=1 Tax=uncultured Phenylobacterium sp. TaxID=349273 RepID=UPI0025DC0515|nr:hypothetical protein [uncultured Phenylobacterium sp.]